MRVSVWNNEVGFENLVITNTGYQQFTFTFNTGSDPASVQIAVWKDGGTGSGNGYADNISLISLAPPNIMTNAGFETGTLSPWTGGGTIGGITTTPANVHSGTHAAYAPVGGGLDLYPSGLTAQTTYVLTFYGMDSSGGGRVSVTASSFYSQPISGSSYQQYSIVFNTGSSPSSVHIQFWKDSGSGYAYADDFALTALSTNLLSNGNFETGNLSGWNTFGTAASITSVPANVNSGTYAVTMPGNGNGIQVNPANLMANTTYNLSFYVKVDTENTVRASVWNAETGFNNQYFSNTSYQQCVFTFSTGNDPGTLQIAFWKDGGTGSGYAYFDDIVLQPSQLYPPDAPFINVKSYGAFGDGSHDDTAALQRAITTAVGSDEYVYLPAGTYLISSSLKGIDRTGSLSPFMTLQGQGQSTTTIKLANNTFTNASSPQPMIQTESSGSAGNEAFDNFISDLTIDTGTGNTGAVGVDYLANNRCAIRNVTVNSSSRVGVTGISMTRTNIGPCLLKNITVNGFNCGMNVANQLYCVTMEHIYLNNQNTYGLYNDSNSISVHDLNSVNSIPAVKNNNALGMITLIQGNLTGGASGNSGIVNSGHLYARAVTTSGYGSAIQGLSGTSVTSYTSETPLSLFSTSTPALALAVQETPTVYSEPTSDWVAVAPSTGGDDTALIQAAMSSGKHTVYFTIGEYSITGTVHVPSSVWHIMGFNSLICPKGSAFSNSSAPIPMLKFEGTTNSTFVEHLTLGQYLMTPVQGAICIDDASSQSLVLSDISFFGGYYGAYKNETGAGQLYLEDIYVAQDPNDFATDWQFSGQTIWARHFDDESPKLKVENNNSTLWILGLKTEQASEVIQTDNGGKTELLGGLVYPLGSLTTPAFICNNSSQSLSYVTDTSGIGNSIQVQETVGTTTLSLTSSSLSTSGHSRGSGVELTLFGR